MSTTTKACWVCGSSRATYWTDNQEGTLLESEEKCPDCGYTATFAYGFSEERIGKYHAEWNYNDPVVRDLGRRRAQCVARLIRRGQLGLLPPEETCFTKVLEETPHDFTTAKVYADWLDEHGRENEAYYLCGYDDAQWFGGVENTPDTTRT